MDLRRIAGKAKELVEKRGGTGALKEDAAELKDIARGPGSVTDKAKRAAEAVKDPGAGGRDDEAPAGAEGKARESEPGGPEAGPEARGGARRNRRRGGGRPRGPGGGGN